MPNVYRYHLTFRDGLHIGRHGIGQENVLAHIPSDTLFAALTTTRARLHDDTGAWAERFLSNPPFRLTSAFPFAGGVHFYPRPFRAPADMDPKAWRRIKFVSQQILDALLNGDVTKDLLPPKPGDELKDGYLLQKGALWLTKSEVGTLPDSLLKIRIDGNLVPVHQKALQHRKVWDESTVPRVTVDRISNTSEIFHTGRIQFMSGCGLWFGIQWVDENVRYEIEELLRVLGDSGIGAERSAGYGAFTFEQEKVPVPWKDSPPGGSMYLLSRFYPDDQKDAETLLNGADYELVLVAGRVQTMGIANQRRQGVYLVAEGSTIGGAARGGMAEVSPKVGVFPHLVYRYGLALGIGLEAKDG